MKIVLCHSQLPYPELVTLTYCPSGAKHTLVRPSRWHGEDDIAVEEASAMVCPVGKA